MTGVLARARRRRLLLLAGAALGVTIIVLLVAGPDPEQALRDAGPELGAWTYAIVGVMAFLETGTFLGLLVPGEAAMLFGGFVAGSGAIDLVTLLAVVWVAAVAGDVLGYWLGRRLGRSFLLRHGPRVGITPERIVWSEAFFDRHGRKAILIGRFLGVVRTVAPFLAGASRMPFRAFLPVDIVAAGLWSLTFTLLGYLFWRSFDRVVELVGHGKLVLVGAVGIAALVALVVRLRRARSGRSG
ncbi:MAG: DedA family protein [Gaiellales bacterium]